ncbi:MAG: AAA family ATPase [Ruminococcaceae bacterium]|nr:AAA family ATPase [Oscillospiraceae bacterium]
MYKIKKITFIDHPILKNLSLDFCDMEGNAVDTVIIAGENGTGKSTLLSELYGISNYRVNFPCKVDIEYDGGLLSIDYKFSYEPEFKNTIFVKDNEELEMSLDIKRTSLERKYPLAAIYSDVDINFHSNKVSYITSLSLDSEQTSRKSSYDLPTQIKQLLIDIQALDDGDVLRAVESNPDKKCSELKLDKRISRFSSAFNRMFDNLSYNRIENENGQKSVLFKKNNVDISIDNLSSGEKQIVYRGCFLLKDINAMKGAFVFIDEPEISLHPNWQMKIMDYYKGIFTNEEGIQTSQIFAVTHSPFVIHNDNRRNDKVIILVRDENGDIIVKDNPEYFKCNSVEVVQDAFSIKSFSAEQPTVYLEGQTDEKYFNKAVDVFGYTVPFRFKWVGYIDENGQEANTGDKSVDKAFHFLVSQNSEVINICLKDCDTNCQTKRVKNVIETSTPKYENSKGMVKGIENALVLDDVDLTPFYVNKEKTGNYGEITKYQEFDKMACCNSICAMDSETLKKVFTNLKEIINTFVKIYEEKDNESADQTKNQANPERRDSKRISKDESRYYTDGLEQNSLKGNIFSSISQKLRKQR